MTINICLLQNVYECHAQIGLRVRLCAYIKE